MERSCVVYRDFEFDPCEKRRRHREEDQTVPPGFRRMAAIPDVLRLHHARLGARDVQTIDGVRVTRPLRTLIDVIDDGVIKPQVEIGLILGEPNYRMVEGQVVRDRQLETVRFCASPASLRKLAEQMVRMADAAETDLIDAKKSVGLDQS